MRVMNFLLKHKIIFPTFRFWDHPLVSACGFFSVHDFMVLWILQQVKLTSCVSPGEQKQTNDFNIYGKDRIGFVSQQFFFKKIHICGKTYFIYK